MKIDYLRATVATAVLAMCLAIGACAERMNRDDFATMVKHKTEQEVLKNIGKPTKVEEPSADRHVWTYTSRTFNVEKQNKLDDKVIVIFKPSGDGKWVVAEVKFE